MTALRLAVGIGLAAAGVAAALLLIGGSDSPGVPDGTESAPPATGRPEAVDLERLRDLAGSVDHAVYWAGEQGGRGLELTVERDGKIFVRYLDQGMAAGSRQASLTIGTYPVSNAFGALKAVAARPGATAAGGPGGGLVVSNEASPNNVYLAYPGADLEIEVFDPDSERALAIATSGDIRPID